MDNSSVNEILGLINDQAKAVGISTYLVGGFVRDLVIKGELGDADIDLVGLGDMQQLSQRCNSLLNGSLKLFPKFLTSKISFSNIDIDFVSARSESYPLPGSLPVVKPGSLEEDLRRRDFSINALAIPLSDFLQGNFGRANVVDIVGGLSDLDLKLIRILHDNSFLDDPTRLFRAYRYARRFDFQFDPLTQQCIENAVANQFSERISLQRVFTEIKKACNENRWVQILGDFFKSGILPPSMMLDAEESDLIVALLENVSVQKVANIDRYDLIKGLMYLTINEEKRKGVFLKASFSKRTLESLDRIDPRKHWLSEEFNDTERLIHELLANQSRERSTTFEPSGR